MKQYFETPDGKLVNLKEVSNIVFDEFFTDRFGNEKPKVIFNFSYGVHLQKSDKIISDYVYSIYTNKSEFEKATMYLSKLINEKNWIAPIISGRIEKIINPDKVSFVTYDADNLRIIVNLSNSVSFNKNYHRMTSDYVYINCGDFDEYLKNKDYIENHLKLLKF